ncbi:mechanosensitive ion channel family protein [Pusillimonas sp.]|uniref:mechanosensitive ion channel family protein n=1 Tax=Pusillimonas sp. TaxID=3040095 RepID=UPI0029A71D53|nr:mechanosensitive ion channel family protein [Pusillimonas sp.]MDX3893722.1 mechanosensitive ion channel family protein [Pusillimonas sp.]
MTKNPANDPSRRARALWLLWPALLCLAFLLLRFFAAYLLRDIISEADLQAIRRFSMAAIIYSAAWLLARVLALALARKTKGKRKTPKLLGELLTASLFTVATIIAVGLLLGRPTGGILASSGLIIAILGFAIRNVLADVLAGIAIGLEAPYRIGDWVEFDSETSGRVIEIGWRTTRILTTNGTYMILPNSHISRQMLTNYSAPRKHYQASLEIVLGHDVPVAQAKQVLLEAAVEACGPDLQKPAVRAARYDAEGITYTVKYWVPSFAEDVDRRDAMLVAIDKAIRRQGLPTPMKRLNFLAVKDTSAPAQGIDQAEGGQT